MDSLLTVTVPILAISAWNAVIARMIIRRKFDLVRDRLSQLPAVVLTGPRQVGKTTLALSIAAEQPSIHLDLENVADRNRLAEPELYLASHEDKLVILD